MCLELFIYNMTDNNTTNLHTTASPFKLKNPTKYHLLATQQQQQGQQQLDETTSLTHVRRPSFVDPLSVMESQPMEFTDSYTQQFLSPISNSSPLQDFDDMESISATGGRQIMMIQPNYYPHFTEGSPSDYSSSVDVFSNHSHPSSYLTEYYNRNQQQDSLSTTTMTASPTMIYYPNNNSNNNRLSMSSVGGGDPHQQVSSSPPQQQPFSAPAHMGYDFMGHMSNLYHHQPQQQSPLTMNRKNSDTTTVTTTLNTLSSSLSTSNAGHHSLEEYESFQLNQQLLLEKKRRRRESHNAGT
ncbi:hypothetical protein BDF20DRAFT_693876 [Mycotypha africana]|uniref:uncharacterized protein n=1 Tax=Mycotypha africana TaxID=64632 RepID=UPI0023006707|nr:uncharacterized protein BDF20DRAFT_693876 [Mycotypha africana]KAI8971688.1 hypothetical protein BDF20DRAFT_693876 [Mycotypha africana]